MKRFDGRLTRLERAQGAGGRSIIFVCSSEDIAEAEAAREQGRPVYLVCNPQHAGLIGGSVSGLVIGGLDLSRDI